MGRVAMVGESMGVITAPRTWLGSLAGYVSLIALLAVGVITAAFTQSSDAAHWPFGVALFAAAFVIVQMLPVPIPHGRQLEMVRFEEAVVVPMALALQPHDALVAIAIGIFAGHVIARAELIKSVFNVAQMVVSTAACLAVVVAIAGPAPGPGARGMLAAVAGLVAMFVVNQLLVAGVMSRAAGQPMHSVLLEDLRLKGLMWSANAALGLMLVLPLFHEPWLLGVSLVPLAFLHASYRAYVDRAHEEVRLRRLQEFTRGLTRELSVEHTARHLVLSARELIGASSSELRLMQDGRALWARSHGSGPVEISDGPADGAPTAAGSDDLKFTIPISGRTGLSGLLTIFHQREAGSAQRSFSARDRTLLEMLVRHAETALDNALLFSRATGQRRKFAQIFEHSSEGLLVLSAGGRVISWNPALATISQFESDQIVDSPIGLISPQLATIPDNQGPGTIDAVMATADGSRRQVRASFAPIGEDGDVVGEDAGLTAWVVVVRDITRERETERLKDDFVATVSHELRTPLTAIKGFLDTMRRKDVTFEGEQVAMFLEIMSEQSDRLERLINDLLDMSAIESGKPLSVSLVPLELSSEVRRATRAFASARPEAELIVHECPIPLMVEADHYRLQQIITNLLENACKHAGSSGAIELSMHQRDDGAQVVVRDYGPGISAADMRHIFDRFFYTSDSVTRNGGGAGLGLYICRKLLDAMDGNIEVSSTVGEGSSFVITLPSVRLGNGGNSENAPRINPSREMREASG